MMMDDQKKDDQKKDDQKKDVMMKFCQKMMRGEKIGDHWMVAQGDRYYVDALPIFNSLNF